MICRSHFQTGRQQVGYLGDRTVPVKAAPATSRIHLPVQKIILNSAGAMDGSKETALSPVRAIHPVPVRRHQNAGKRPLHEMDRIDIHGHPDSGV
jgi:hypothetical protein